jgi:hypothetical protein
MFLIYLNNWECKFMGSLYWMTLITTLFDLGIFVELVFRWIKIGLAFSRLVDQKGIGENSEMERTQNNGAAFCRISVKKPAGIVNRRPKWGYSGSCYLRATV